MDEAIENIVDGTPVDWTQIERRAETDGNAAWTADLHIIQDVANFYRLSSFGSPQQGPASTSETGDGEATLELAIGEEPTARYQAGLRQLARPERRAVIGRLELWTSYYDLAAVLGFDYRGTRTAARVARAAVTRALKRLMIEMGHV